jgi:hypothetical protein
MTPHSPTPTRRNWIVSATRKGSFMLVLVLVLVIGRLA